MAPPPYLQDWMKEKVIPFHHSLFEGSFILRKVCTLLIEVINRAKRPAFMAHVSPALPTLENETCPICWEALEFDIANSEAWERSHSAVVTSCGHIFGGTCLFTCKISRLYSAYSTSPLHVRKLPLFTLFSKFWVNKVVIRTGLEVLIVPESLEHYVDSHMSIDGLALYAEQ